MPSTSRFSSLFHGLQLLLDVLRRPILSHIACHNLCARGKDPEMVLYPWMGSSDSTNNDLRFLEE